jgi:hypothetical protein
MAPSDGVGLLLDPPTLDAGGLLPLRMYRHTALRGAQLGIRAIRKSCCAIGLPSPRSWNRAAAS